jgi:hypothetical protein
VVARTRDLARHRLQPTAIRVETDDDGPQTTLVRDRGPERHQLDVGDRAERNDPPAAGGDRQARQSRRVMRYIGRQLQHDLGLAIRLEDATDRHAAQRRPQRPAEGRGGYAGAEKGLPTRADPDAGSGERTRRMHPGRTRHGGESLGEERSSLLQPLEIRAAQVDQDFGPRALQDLLDALVQELLEIEGEAADFGDPRTHRLCDTLGILGRDEADQELAALRPPGIFPSAERPICWATDRTPGTSGAATVAPAPIPRDRHRRTGHVHHEISSRGTQEGTRRGGTG